MELHLKECYGYENFRKCQQEIIKDVLDLNDILVILPTGGGKSLLYQFPATYTNKISIVVSPLISLMNDQCHQLKKNGIKCCSLNSETVDYDNLEQNQIIYTTPEFLTANIDIFLSFQELICVFAIDEAHCISQWSQDFRSSYKKLNILKQKFPMIPILSLTATATPIVIDDIYTMLNIENVIQYSLGTTRTNLSINVIYTKPSFFELLTLINKNESTIIYTQTRKECMTLFELFGSHFVPCLHYHGGMDAREKQNSYLQFMNDEIKLIIATVSFGMGINKSNIRHVINYSAPTDLETYYQEIGRAGRDGMESKATLFYTDQDFRTTLCLINNNPSKIKLLTIFRQYLNETILCRHQIIDHYFETGLFLTNKNQMKCVKCDNCTRPEYDSVNITTDAHHIVDLVTLLPYHLGIQKLGLILVGSKNVSIKNEMMNAKYGCMYGKSTKYCKNSIEFLINKNILQREIYEKNFIIKLGSELLINHLPIVLHMKPVMVKDKKPLFTW